MTLDKTDPEIIAAFALLDAQLEAERKNKMIPGLSVAVVYDQEIIWAKGFGYSNLEKKISADQKTIYRIGSITKLFTSTMLMQLRDAEKLHLDEPIEKYLSTFKIKSSFSNSRSPTFLQVVSHTAGLPREAPLDYWQTLKFPSINVVLKSLKNAEIIFPTMTEIKYSNLGIAILGHALERIANKPYKQYVKEHILQPLGMNNSGFDLSDEMKTHMAIGYFATKDNESHEIAPHPDIGAFAPAGQLYSSVEDISHFISLQFRDNPIGGKQILGGSTLREMHSPVFMAPNWKGGIAIGWALRQKSGHTCIGHGGGIYGFTADITLVIDMKLGIAVFVNTGMDLNNIVSSAIDLLIPVFSRVLSRKQADPIRVAPHDLQKYTGHYSMLRPDKMEMEIRIAVGKLVAIFNEEPPGTEITFIPESKHNFRMEGGFVNGELATFELSEGGNITQVKLGNFTFERVPPRFL